MTECKRGRGRPAGRTYTCQVHIWLTPAQKAKIAGMTGEEMRAALMAAVERK